MVKENIFSTSLKVYNTVPSGAWPSSKSNNNNNKLRESMNKKMNW